MGRRNGAYDLNGPNILTCLFKCPQWLKTTVPGLRGTKQCGFSFLRFGNSLTKSTVQYRNTAHSLWLIDLTLAWSVPLHYPRESSVNDSCESTDEGFLVNLRKSVTEGWKEWEESRDWDLPAPKAKQRSVEPAEGARAILVPKPRLETWEGKGFAVTEWP